MLCPPRPHASELCPATGERLPAESDPGAQGRAGGRSREASEHDRRSRAAAPGRGRRSAGREAPSAPGPQEEQPPSLRPALLLPSCLLPSHTHSKTCSEVQIFMAAAAAAGTGRRWGQGPEGPLPHSPHTPPPRYPRSPALPPAAAAPAQSGTRHSTACGRGTLASNRRAEPPGRQE